MPRIDDSTLCEYGYKESLCKNKATYIIFRGEKYPDDTLSCDLHLKALEHHRYPELNITHKKLYVSNTNSTESK